MSVEPLPGGITASMDRITLDRRDVILRRWPDESEPGPLVAQESAALRAVRGCDVPTPELIAADEDGSAAGVPCTLTTALPGQPDLNPNDLPSWLEQLASAQALIHAVPATLREHKVVDRYAEHERPLEWVADPGLRAAARAAADGALDPERVLVHGDYQHFNVLWEDGRLTGVVDWPHGATGRRGSDVGHCRLSPCGPVRSGRGGGLPRGARARGGVRIERRADLRALLCFTSEWQEFIPRQVHGRAPLDVPGMPARVAATVRAAVEALP